MTEALPAARPGREVELVARPHPFSQAVERRTMPDGLTIERMLEAAQPDPVLRRHAVVFIDDWIIPRDKWHCVKPRAGRLVTIAVRPSGGGEGGKNPLRTVLTLAVVAASIAVPALAPAGSVIASGTIGGALVSAGIGVAGGLLVNSIVPPGTPKFGRSGGGATDIGAAAGALGIEGTRNQARPFQPVPRVLGEHRMTPPLGAKPFTEIVGGNQYLRMLFVWGYGPLDVDDIKIGETPIGEFEDVEVETKASAAELGDPLTLYPDRVTEQSLNVVLSKEAGWQQRRTEPGVDEFIVDLTWPQGLVEFEDDGSKSALTVDVEVESRPVSGGSWTSHGTISTTDRTSGTIRRGGRFTVARDQYDVRLRRTTADRGGDGQFDVVHWTALRSVTDEDPILMSGVARTAVRIRATEQLQGVIDQLNGVVTSIVPDWDSGTQTWITRATRNPASL